MDQEKGTLVFREDLERRFGTDNIIVGSKQRKKGKPRFDDEETNRPQGQGARFRRPSPEATETPPQPTQSTTPPASTAPPAPETPGVGGKTPGVVTTATPAVVEVKKEEKTVGTVTQTQQPDLESCAVCGGLKEKTRKMPDGRIIKLLTCGACSRAYKAYVEQATKAVIADPVNAPEPMTKFAWVLGGIDLPRFATEAIAAVAAYREKYNATVVAVLRQRRYLDGESKWGTESYLRRPQIRFTRDAFQSGIAATVRQGLEEKLGDDYKTMRRLVGRLEAATRVEPELREALAKAAVPAAPPAAHAASAETDVTLIAPEVPAPAETKVAKTPRKRTAKAAKV